MAQSKMNVFHFHIVDDQSFPYDSISYPLLAEKGSWTGTASHIYSQTEIAYVINYAYKRGIRVVVEFDTPGHTLSWGKGYPFLLTECYTDGEWNGQYGPINIVPNSTYEFMKTFFT